MGAILEFLVAVRPLLECLARVAGRRRLRQKVADPFAAALDVVDRTLFERVGGARVKVVAGRF